jgi:DNA-binding transcriptional regulator YiaG
MKSIESPFSDKKLFVQRRMEIITFRKEEFEVVYHFYEDTGQQFTTDETDEVNLKQVYNQYREKYNLPFPEEIVEIREKYGIPATKMSEVLGFGVNIYRQYENGEVPSQSNARLIQLAKDPEEFCKLIKLSGAFNDKEFEKVTKRVTGMIQKKKSNIFQVFLSDYVMGTKNAPSRLNGYKLSDLPKTVAVMCQLIENLKPTKTALNKLLFYVDFLHYRNHAVSMMGLEYRAAPFGTVPSRYDSLLEYVDEHDFIKRNQQNLGNGYWSETYTVNKKTAKEKVTFKEDEQSTIDEVIKLFRNKNATEIVKSNHRETAWINNQQEKQLVDYKYAFDLKYSK